MPFIKKTLENILGEERFNSFKDTKKYIFLVEAFTMNTFSLAITTPLELGVAGMTMLEFAKARSIGAVASTLLGRPYGVYREYVFKLFGVHQESSFLKKYI